jgi:hypothetical protein
MKRMAYVLFAAAVAATTPATIVAQRATLAGDLLRDWTAQKETMMKIGDAMPETKFGFKATPPERSYGEQILHVAGANVMLMKFLGGKSLAPAIDDSDLTIFGLKATSKADVLKALSDSYDYGESVLREFPDAAITQTIKGPRWIGDATRAKMVYYTLGHAQDIYGQMAVYLRLNGIVPPASRRGGV